MSEDVRMWLITEATKLEWSTFLDAFSRRLIAAGVPVDRAWSGRLFLNPLVAGDAFTWYSDGTAKRTVLPFANRAVATPPSGPMRRVFEERIAHQPLVGLSREQFDLPRELFDDGYTDFVGFGTQWKPSPAADAGVARVAMTFATKSSNGFDAAALATFDQILDTLRVVIRLMESERLTRGLLGTYLGQQAADRVLDGQVRRGDGETVRAALWFSDLRGFTTLSDRLTRSQLLTLLDDAFEAQGAAIHAHGGEILKFIGDGLLAVFRGEPDESCRRALAAAAQFEALLVDVNARRVASGEVPVSFGLALHHGDVMYGNIGAPDRLDFTVIGPDVNLAARLEGLSSKLGRSVVMSQTFAAACGADVIALGAHPVKGLGDPIQVFAPR